MVAGRGRREETERGSLSHRSEATTISQSSVCLGLIPTKRLRLSLQSFREGNKGSKGGRRVREV